MENCLKTFIKKIMLRNIKKWLINKKKIKMIKIKKKNKMMMIEN